MLVLYGGNGKAAKAESESINDRQKRSMIGRRVKTTEDLARELQKCTGYMLPSFVYPAISCTKLAAFVVRRGAGRKGRVTRSMVGHAFTIFARTSILVHCTFSSSALVMAVASYGEHTYMTTSEPIVT